MGFSEKTLNTLEFDKIRTMLEECAPTEGAKERARCLLPSDDEVTVRRNLTHTTDARRLTDAKGIPPFGGIRDVSGACERAEKGAMLTTRELLEVARVLHAARALTDYNKSLPRSGASSGKRRTGSRKPCNISSAGPIPNICRKTS